MKRRGIRDFGNIPVFALFASGLLLTSITFASPTLRKVQIQHGDFKLIGNTLGFDCRSGTGDPLPGKGSIDRTKCGNNINDTSIDVYWQVDSPGAGQAQANKDVVPAQASSQAKLELPAGAVVTYARVYWAASIKGALAVPPAPALDDFKTATLARRNAAHTMDIFSQPLTADIPVVTVNNPENEFSPGRAVQASMDVTTLVKTYGSGEYLMRDVPVISILNEDYQSLFAAWWMVVFYELPGDPVRHLALFDDLAEVSQPVGKNTVTAEVNGFVVPNVGFDGKFGVIAYEGDNTFTGDQLLFQSGLSTSATQLSNALNDPTNFFNGTRSWLGTPVSVVGDLPQMTGQRESMHGIDMDVMNITSLLQNNDVKATLTAKTSQETFFLAGFVTSISSFQPLFSDMMKTYQNTSGTNDKIKQGHIVEYTISGMKNSGNDNAAQTVWSDVLPTNVDYVPGSLFIKQGITWAPLTDVTGDDVGDYNALTRTLTVRLGTGANATQGGTINVGQSSGDIKFQVKVQDEAVGNVSNQAQISTKGALAPSTAPAFIFVSGDGVTKGVPTIFPIFICDTDADCKEGTPFCDKSIPSNPVCTAQCHQDSDCVAIFGDDWVCQGKQPDGPKYCYPTADLGLVVTSSEANLQNEVSYEIGITNAGPGRPPSAVVTYTIPQNGQVTAVEANPNWTCTLSPGVLTCVSNQPIEQGSSFVARIVVTGELGSPTLLFHGTVQPTGMLDLHQQNNTVDLTTGLKELGLAGGGFTCNLSSSQTPFSVTKSLQWLMIMGCLAFLFWQRTVRRKNTASNQNQSI